MALTHSTAGGRARPGGESRQRGELPSAGSDFGTRRAAFPPCPAGRGRRGRCLTLGWLGVSQQRLRCTPSELVNECSTTGEPTYARHPPICYHVHCAVCLVILGGGVFMVVLRQESHSVIQIKQNALWSRTCGDVSGYKAENWTREKLLAAELPFLAVDSDKNGQRD